MEKTNPWYHSYTHSFLSEECQIYSTELAVLYTKTLQKALQDANQKIRLFKTNERLVSNYITLELTSDPFRWSYVSQLLGVFMPGYQKMLCEMHHYKQLPFQLPGGILTLYLHGQLFYLSLVLGNCPFGHNLKTRPFENPLFLPKRAFLFCFYGKVFFSGRWSFCGTVFWRMNCTR